MQAQESPEAVFDISDCGLKNVPAGVYSKCMIGRKEALLLQDNELTQLGGGGTLSDLAKVLQVLDLHGNHLEKLPEEIGTLRELKVRTSSQALLLVLSQVSLFSFLSSGREIELFLFVFAIPRSYQKVEEVTHKEGERQKEKLEEIRERDRKFIARGKNSRLLHH